MIKVKPKFASSALKRWPSPASLLLSLVALLLLLTSCDTPYTRRVSKLDKAYQQGDLSREDYMRFVHDAERWETR